MRALVKGPKTIRLEERPRPEQKTVLEVEDLVKFYRGSAVPALNGFSVSIGEGGVLGLLGPNGAGKTTAISIMTTLLRPTSGRLTLCGVDVLKNPREARRLIGLVPQEIALYPSLSARENLRYFGRLHGRRGKALEGRIEECLEMVGLEESADRPVSTYSGGMKRRANLAAGVLHEPRILFLDEPTVGIDAQSRNLILENLGRMKERGMTLVYTTHYMEEARQLCTQVAIVDGGRVLAEGPPDELVAGAAGCANLEELFLQLTGKRLRD
ncbi:ABC-type multidrug transport system, ATPase component [Desulfuromonas soudanensis]|uniref:ABC-type multidrug transport system, ATPase component n=1 Tax=Desulfuromonas soudanensis TaxID=1603606 RepID=A0A0M4D5H7_9BACT|nr:ABC transporter ATP-binding protein [Desulfuromonas soudanensis]ALC16022.1 ABC-type multidrug transport system, ATPase component [Desulfuromonas soudanensis]